MAHVLFGKHGQEPRLSQNQMRSDCDYAKPLNPASVIQHGPTMPKQAQASPPVWVFRDQDPTVPPWVLFRFHMSSNCCNLFEKHLPCLSFIGNECMGWPDCYRDCSSVSTSRKLSSFSQSLRGIALQLSAAAEFRSLALSAFQNRSRGDASKNPQDASQQTCCKVLVNLPCPSFFEGIWPC